jgi:hypothetical protein
MAGHRTRRNGVKQETIDEINAVCNLLVTVASSVREDNDATLALHNHVELIKHYNHLRLATARIKEAREALAEMEEKLSREQIPDIFREQGIKTTTIEGVGRVTVSYRFSCSMLDKEQGLEWLRGNGHGGIIIETVNSSTLSAFAKSMLEESGAELPDAIFKTSTSPYTSITKVK